MHQKDFLEIGEVGCRMFPLPEKLPLPKFLSIYAHMSNYGT